jgi:hypothetical protein
MQWRNHFMSRYAETNPWITSVFCALWKAIKMSGLWIIKRFFHGLAGMREFRANISRCRWCYHTTETFIKYKRGNTPWRTKYTKQRSSHLFTFICTLKKNDPSLNSLFKLFTALHRSCGNSATTGGCHACGRSRAVASEYPDRRTGRGEMWLANKRSAMDRAEETHRMLPNKQEGRNSITICVYKKEQWPELNYKLWNYPP